MANQFTQDSLIQSTFSTAWSDQTPVFFENHDVDSSSMPDEFINVLSLAGSKQNISLSPVKTRCFCSVVGEIRVPKGEGKGRALTLAQDFEDIFENKQIGIMHFSESSRSEINARAHYGINVFIPYQWEYSNA